MVQRDEERIKIRRRRYDGRQIVDTDKGIGVGVSVGVGVAVIDTVNVNVNADAVISTTNVKVFLNLTFDKV